MISLYTVGHSLHSIEHFVGLLRAQAIARLVDVRSHPASKRAPQFGKAELTSSLAAHEIEYVFMGRSLGGRPAGAEFYRPDGSVDYARRALAADFRAGIEELVAMAQGSATAILCAEEDPSHCHRERLVAPALRQGGVSVLHIRGAGQLESEAEYAARERQLGLFR